MVLFAILKNKTLSYPISRNSLKNYPQDFMHFFKKNIVNSLKKYFNLKIFQNFKFKKYIKFKLKGANIPIILIIIW